MAFTLKRYKHAITITWDGVNFTLSVRNAPLATFGLHFDLAVDAAHDVMHAIDHQTDMHDAVGKHVTRYTRRLAVRQRENPHRPTKKATS